MSNSNTPYDDAFRTLLTDCSRLIIPVVNVMFHDNYTSDDAISLYQNEFFITEGGEEKRITDSNFSIGKNSKCRYHIECQSSPDGSIIIRVFEYATQIAILTAVSDSYGTSFELPKSGILYLRSTGNTKEYTITVNAPNGKCLSYEVPVIRIADYTLEHMLKKDLWFLIPFYFFNYDLDKMENSDDMINEMVTKYTDLWQKLDEYVNAGSITEFEKSAIKAMCDKVAEALSAKHSNVQKGVLKVMGGQVLDYEAKRIYREAKKETEIKAVLDMISFGVPEDKILSKYSKEIYEEALKRTESTTDELKEM